MGDFQEKHGFCNRSIVCFPHQVVCKTFRGLWSLFSFLACRRTIKTFLVLYKPDPNEQKTSLSFSVSFLHFHNFHSISYSVFHLSCSHPPLFCHFAFSFTPLFLFLFLFFASGPGADPGFRIWQTPKINANPPPSSSYTSLPPF